MQPTQKIAQTATILKRVQQEHNPKAWVWLFSGGDDSLACGTACAEALQEVGEKIDYAIFCDTGTCIPETKQFVVDTCHAMSIPLLIGTTTDKDSYEKYVLRFGFPGQNHRQHTVMYRMLKAHSLSRCISQIRQKRKHFPIALLTGARIDESTRRMATAGKAIEKRGSDIWVNPIHHWTKTDIHHYFGSKQVERSIVAQTIGRSGECNCGVFGSPQELDEIRIVSPTFYAYMCDLEARVMQKGFCWGWGQSPPTDLLQIAGGQLQMEGMQSDHYAQTMFMCSTCMNNNTYKTEVSPEKERAYQEYKILESVCEDRNHILAIGQMLAVQKQLLPEVDRLRKIHRIIEANC